MRRRHLASVVSTVKANRLNGFSLELAELSHHVIMLPEEYDILPFFQMR